MTTAETDRLRNEIGAVRERCQTLRGFIKEAWHVLEPVTKYKECWHHGAIAEHLEAIHRKQILRLQINQPPGTMKSLVASVMWQPWEWGPGGMPGLRYFTSSYQSSYARRDSRKARDLIMSDWYKMVFPEIKLLRDNEVDFENTMRGNRKAMSFESLTSGRGNRVIIDDPHSTEQVESELELENARRIFRESVPSRVDDPQTDAILIIMHRLNPRDLCGVIDDLGLDYVKLVLPMEYDPAVMIPSSYFEDPRTEKGELLCPETHPRDVVDRFKKELGGHGYATQFQQQPSFREGGMFKRHWFKLAGATPADVVKRVRKWDLAATVDAGSWTVGLLMAQTSAGHFYVEDVKRFRDSAAKVRQSIRDTCNDDLLRYKQVRTIISQDPGQAGKAQSESIIAENAGHRIFAERETGDKATRAEPFAAQVEAGNVFILERAWTNPFIDELSEFPQGEDDQVDAASGAFNGLVGVRTLNFEGVAEKLAAKIAQTPQTRNFQLGGGGIQRNFSRFR